MMCNAEVTASLVPTVAKQIQSVDPVGKETHGSMVNPCSLGIGMLKDTVTGKMTTIFTKYAYTFSQQTTTIQSQNEYRFKMCRNSKIQ